MDTISGAALENAPPFDEAGPGKERSATAESDPVTILATVDAVVYDWNLATDRLTWSPNAAATLAGFAPAELATGAGYAARITSDSESSRFHAIRTALARDEGQGVPFRASYRLSSSDGKLHAVEDFGRWFADAGGRPCHVHGVVRVLSRTAGGLAAPDSPPAFAAEEALCTRRAFNEMVDARCRQALRSDSAFAVLIVGFDDLASINRGAGYDAVDEMIAAVGRRLVTCLRASDKIAKYSGSKFAVLLSLGSLEQLQVATRRIVRILNHEPIPTSAGALRAAARVGAALAPSHGRNAHLLLQRAEEAFDMAADAADRYSLFTHSHAIGESRRRETRVADEIVAALNERRMALAFQPVLGADHQRAGFEEALLRVRQDDGNWLGPAGMLPVAEKLGLVEQIDQRVLELTLDRLAADPTRRVSMNLSAATLRAPDWLDRLKAGLRSSPGAAERLIVEIPESQVIDNVVETARVFAAMKSQGVRIAIDDFGSGHVSFRNLRDLGVDMVKIDGAFVQDLGRSMNDRFFVRTLASLARRLGIETVAEWVEDMEAVRLLTEWGVDYLQGHFIGRATTPETPSAEAPLAYGGARKRVS